MRSRLMSMLPPERRPSALRGPGPKASRNRTVRRGSRSWLVLLHLLLEFPQLPVGGGFVGGAVELCLEQLVRRIHAGTRSPGCLQVAPGTFRRALRLGERPVAFRPAQLRLHVPELALVQCELALQGRQLLVEYADSLAVLPRKPLGDLHRLPVLDLGCKPAAAL